MGPPRNLPQLPGLLASLTCRMFIFNDRDAGHGSSATGARDAAH